MGDGFGLIRTQFGTATVRQSFTAIKPAYSHYLHHLEKFEYRPPKIIPLKDNHQRYEESQLSILI